MQKKYIVELTVDERSVLEKVVKKLIGTSQKVKRAGISLKADAGGPGWTDGRICRSFELSHKNGRKRAATIW